MTLLRIVCTSLLYSIAGVSQGAPLCASARNTIELTQCMGPEIDEAEKNLATYLAAAKSQVRQEPEVKVDLNAAQEAWQRYRTVHCGDVYVYSSQGTDRYRQAAQCQLDLIRERAHDLWAAYLKPADSTPAVFPEP